MNENCLRDLASRSTATASSTRNKLQIYSKLRLSNKNSNEPRTRS